MSGRLIGIDIGTSRVKAVMFDEVGKEISSYAADNKVYNPSPDRSEQDMLELWQVVCRCIRRVMEQSGAKAEDVLGVGVSGQGEGLWLVDDHDDPVAMARLWNDGRAKETALAIRQLEDMEKKLNMTIGGLPKSGTTISQVVHAARYDGKMLKKAKRLFFCKDYIRFMLTGEAATDKSDASTSLLDLNTMKPASALFEELGVPELTDLIPPVLNPCDMAGRITEEAAELTGLAKGTPVATGMLDLISASLGVGAVNKGDICITMGTTLMHQVITQGYSPSEKTGISWEANCKEGLFSRLLGTMAGTPNLNWALSILYGIPGFDPDFVTALEDPLSKIPIGSKGVMFHPYTSVSGERAPFINEKASGSFSGLKSTTTREQMLRSVYEGVVLSSYDCLANFGKLEGRVFLSGGGATSPFWVQMLADCLDMEMCITAEKELAAKGAAIAAGVACGLYSDPVEIAGNVAQIERSYMPNKENHKRFMELYNVYKNLRENVVGYWDDRAAFLLGGK